MDAVFARLNLRARVPLCGLISGYNDDEPPPGPRGVRADPDEPRARSRASSSSTTSARPRRSRRSSAAGWQRGTLKAQETVVEGFEELPEAVNMLFDGKNVGKLVV